MAQWLGQAFQGHEMYCHDLEVMGLNPCWVEFEMVVFLSKSYLNQTYPTDHYPGDQVS